MKLAHTIGYMIGCFAAGAYKGFRDAFARQTAPRQEPTEAPVKSYECRHDNRTQWHNIDATSPYRAAEKFISRELEPTLAQPGLEERIASAPERVVHVVHGDNLIIARVRLSIVEEQGARMLKAEAVS